MFLNVYTVRNSLSIHELNVKVKLCFPLELSLSLLLPAVNRLARGASCLPIRQQKELRLNVMSLSLPSLRTWRSTIYATSSRDPRALAVESPASINNRLSQQQQHYESSVTELRRRLARKASTFSLRSKSRRSQRQLREQLVKQEEESDTASVETVKQEEVKVQQVRSHSIGVALELPAPSPALPDSGVLPAFEKGQLFRTVTQARRKDHTSVSMSSESSPPPVPLAKLQTITTEVCVFHWI